MAVSVVVPQLGPEDAGGVLAEWYAGDGDAVAAGQPICRLEHDWVTFEVEAEEDGVLSYVAAAGEAQRAGDVLAYVLAPGEELAPEPAGDDDAPELAAKEEGLSMFAEQVASMPWGGAAEDPEPAHEPPPAHEAPWDPADAEADDELAAWVAGDRAAAATPAEEAPAEVEHAAEAGSWWKRTYEPAAETAEESPGAWLTGGVSDDDTEFWPSWRGEAEEMAEGDQVLGSSRWGASEDEFVAQEEAYWSDPEPEPESEPAAAEHVEEHEAVEPAHAGQAVETDAEPEGERRWDWNRVFSANDEAAVAEDAGTDAVGHDAPSPDDTAAWEAYSDREEVPHAEDGATVRSPEPVEAAWEAEHVAEEQDAAPAPEPEPAAVAHEPSEPLGFEHDASETWADAQPADDAEPTPAWDAEHPVDEPAAHREPDDAPAWPGDAEDAEHEPFGEEGLASEDDAVVPAETAAHVEQDDAPAWPDDAEDAEHEPFGEEGLAWEDEEVVTVEPAAHVPQPLTLRVALDLSAVDGDGVAVTSAVATAAASAVAELAPDLPHVDGFAARIYEGGSWLQTSVHARDEDVVFGDEAVEAGCWLTSFAGAGVREATARVCAEHPIAFALGAAWEEAAFEGRGFVSRRTALLTLTYDGEAVADEVAAALIAAARDFAANREAMAA